MKLGKYFVMKLFYSQPIYVCKKQCKIVRRPTGGKTKVLICMGMGELTFIIN